MLSYIKAFLDSCALQSEGHAEKPPLQQSHKGRAVLCQHKLQPPLHSADLADPGEGWTKAQRRMKASCPCTLRKQSGPLLWRRRPIPAFCFLKGNTHWFSESGSLNEDRILDLLVETVLLWMDPAEWTQGHRSLPSLFGLLSDFLPLEWLWRCAGRVPWRKRHIRH